MTNLSISYINCADSATLTANPAALATKPITYLQNDARGYLFGAAAPGSQEIKGTWSGTAYTVGHIKLDRTNLVDGDTWRVQLYSDTAWTTGVYDSGVVAPFAAGLFSTWSYSFAELWLASQTTGVKSFKITVVSASAFQASKLYVGPYTTAQWNPKYGMSMNWEGNSKQERWDSGTLGVQTRAQWRALNFDLFASTDAERAVWQEIGRYCGNFKTVSVSVFPNVGGAQERDNSMICKFEDSPEAKWSNLSIYDLSVKLKEI